MSIKNGALIAARENLKKYEKTVDTGLLAFVEAGKALGMLRLEKLYALAGFADFDTYVEHRFSISPRHADRLISAARVVLLLGPIGRLINNESTARELAVFSRDEADKMRAVVEAATVDGRVTAARIRTARDELYPEYRTIEGEFREGGRPQIEGPAPADITPALGQAIADAAERAAPPRDGILCPAAGDHEHCAVCGKPIPSPNQQGGYLRCKTCDPRQEHIAAPTLDGQWGDCRECSHKAAGAVPPASTEDTSPVLGEPDVDEQAASTSGTPDSPAADSLPPQAHAGVPAVGGQIEERDEERAGYPETFDDLGCPVCSFTIEVSEEDPDASLSEMYNHIWRQCAMGEGEERRRSAHDLLARVRQISPAADPLAPPSPQQPGQDSPTGLEAAQPREGRSETDHQQDAGVSSPAGEAPEVASTDPVEPVELEGGGTAQDPPSSSDPVVIYATVENIIGTSEEIEIPRAEWDAMTPAQRRYAIADFGDTLVSNAGGWGSGIQSGAPDSDLDDVDQPPSSSDPGEQLLLVFAEFVYYLDGVDFDAVGPMLRGADLEALHSHVESITAYVGKLGRARFAEMLHTP